MADKRPVIILCTLLVLFDRSNGAQQYLGKFLGKLSELHHGVSGEVYAVDARTLHLKDFTYDGEGPAAYFWAGTTRSPGAAGFRVRDENGSGAVLKRYRRKSITLTLPDGKTLNNIKWFSVWCEEFAVNFGDVKIPRNFDYPKPQKIEGLRGVHGVSSDNIVLVDAQTLLIPNFSYDGEAPDAKFWVGRGSKPSPQGIRVPDENGKEIPLRRYDKKTVVLTLPGDLTVFDIGHFGVWCEAFTVDFGHVIIPQTLNVPPSLKMLGVSPQSKLNCEVLQDDLAFEVRWAVAGESIVIQLVAKLEDGEYMSFGLSGDKSKTEMVGGDVVVAWVDRQSLKGYAEDYYLEAKSQCSGPRGSCPDNNIAENTNNIRLLNAAMVNGYSIVTYQRPLKASDELDREVLTNQSQSIIWAIGPLNQRNEVSFHSQYTKKDHLLDFGRPANWNCPLPDSDSTSQQSQSSRVVHTTTSTTTISPRRKQEDGSTETTTRGRGNERRRGGNRDGNVRRRDEERAPPRRRVSNAVTTVRSVPTPKPVTERNAWHIPAIQCYEPDDGVFYAQMGPTGGKRGYSAITGHVGWGISWYINGLLIPEINVVRGKTYTFVVEGGLNPEVPAKYHPFYITDDPIGGYEYKTPDERQNVQIFAGAKQTRDGKVYPTGVGRLCHWTHTGDMEADEFQSFGAFQRTLELRCDEGEPGVITWTPDANTPDTVYYQCFTHRYLGWKINVVDSCNSQPEAEASEAVAVLALPNNGDLKSSSSIIVETRINPNDLFQTTQTKQIPDRPASVKNSDYSYHDDLGSQLGQEGQDHFQTHFQTTSEIPVTRNPISSSDSNTKTTILHMNVRKPIYNDNKFTIRRPVSVNRPPFMVKPHFSMRRPPSMHGPYKKTYYRIPLRKRPMNRPFIENQHKMARPKPINQQHPHKTSPRPNKQKTIISSTTSNPNIKKTESSSEKTFSSELISVKKQLDEFSTMHPAINTGFKPESVVIEGGFKPIITKEIQERIFKSDSDESVQQEDIGVIKLNVEENSQQFIESFEPMFIPSPPDSQLLLRKKQNATKLFKRFPVVKKNPSLMFIVKHVGRSSELNEPEDDLEDEVAMAAERVEAYYLPPDIKKSKPIDRIRKPSNIDIPPGSVVTFDGKTVSGSSLTAPVSEISKYETQSPKASEILRFSPQFGPFKGEIPPLETQNINVRNLPQLNSQAVINRDLNAPAPAPPSNSGTQTTKLQPVSTQQYKSKTEARSKRYAHHTPEHTAVQQMQNHNHTDSHENKINEKNHSSYIKSNFYFMYVIVFNLMNTYLNFK